MVFDIFLFDFISFFFPRIFLPSPPPSLYSLLQDDLIGMGGNVMHLVTLQVYVDFRLIFQTFVHSIFLILPLLC